MKRLLMMPLLLSSLAAFGHDEGHGPKLDDSPREGGMLAPVVLASEAKLGPKAALVYKAELVRGEDGAVKVFLYDGALKPLMLAGLSPKANAALLTEWKGKATKTNFTLTLDRVIWAYVGKAPKAPRKPYNIDVTFSEGKRKLLSAFDNLD